MSQIKQLNLVPTSHNFGYVVNEYIRIKLNNESIDNFFHKKKYTKSTLKAYCYPFQKKEFNLNNESLDSLKKLKEDSFEWLNKKHKLGFFVTDDKNYICLKNTWLVGHLNKNYPNIDHSKKLILSNFAGTKNATSAIFTVGKSTGIYFKLLDMKGNPTKNFEKFYCNNMSLLENRLKIIYMEHKQKKNTKEALINYFKGKNSFKKLGLNLLDQHYTWQHPEFFYDGSPLEMSGSNFSKNVKIKHKLHEIWQKEKSSRKNIVKWIIKDWGGIKGNKESTLNFYNIEANKNLPETPYRGIASFSKVLSIKDPYKYAIYDARVAVSLNAIQLIENVSEGSAFPYLSGRNNITGNDQKKIGFSNQKETEIKTLTNKPYNWSKILEENVYSYYINILLEIAKELRCPLYELEMSLFSEAEKLACIVIPSLSEHTK